jgi:hypothetical protein
VATTHSLIDVVPRWASAVGVDPIGLPSPAVLAATFREDACRPPVTPQRLANWQRRYGFRLPRGLAAWLSLSDCLYLDPLTPLIHPLMAIGPMIPFARVPGLVVQPESWFELGNPGEETVCIDLAYCWPGGGCPIFTSGDDQRATRPRLIAPSFEDWLSRLLHERGRSFWFDSGFQALGDPWDEHRHRTPVPPLPARLKPLAARARPLMRPGADDRSVAHALGISRADVESLFRHLQHAVPG